MMKITSENIYDLIKKGESQTKNLNLKRHLNHHLQKHLVDLQTLKGV